MLSNSVDEAVDGLGREICFEPMQRSYIYVIKL